VKATICDVGPRDGLQNEPETLEPAVRAELVNRLAATGVPRVEAASFVRPDAVPQMAGAEEVAAAIERRDGAAYAGLVLNEKGFERLRGTELDEVHVSFGVTETFNRRNANASVEESLDATERIVGRAREAQLPTAVSLSVAFGCPFEGRVDPGRVLDLAERVSAAGADEVVLADTIGVAVPRQVRQLVADSTRLGRRVGLHLHDTRNTALANAYAGLESGASAFDASVGGIGGCPFAPHATGNVATEDLVYLLEGERVETGIDLDALVGVAEWLAGVLGRDLPGSVYRAGLPEPEVR